MEAGSSGLTEAGGKARLFKDAWALSPSLHGIAFYIIHHHTTAEQTWQRDNTEGELSHHQKIRAAETLRAQR